MNHNLEKFFKNIEREYGREARKTVGYYLAMGYTPSTALEMTGIKEG